jgi:hypothetical protein
METFSQKMRHLHYSFDRTNSLSKKGDDVIGWLCAQKRLPESLAASLKMYNQITTDLPDYLLLIDDDTFLNLALMAPELQTSFPSHHAYATAGCMVGKMEHSFPWGGFGTIFTRKALERFLQPLPLECSFQNSTALVKHLEPNVAVRRDHDLTPEEFEALACDRISENLIGERSVYQKGMSLTDMSQAYIHKWNYTSAQTWGETLPGFCLHSDWVIG